MTQIAGYILCAWCYQPEFQVQVDNNNLVEMWEKLVVERSDEEQVEVGVT